MQASTKLTALNGKTIVFVGGGNMTSALIDGLLTAKKTHNLDVTIGVSDRNQYKLDVFAAKGVKTALSDNAYTLIGSASVVVLAVKPQVMGEVCMQIREALADKLLISVAAGLSVAKLVDFTGNQRLVRTIPNLPATVGLGATGLFADDVSCEDKEVATAIMAASGITVWVDREEDLHAVTTVAGSAPAYFFYVLENMIDKAVAMGLDKVAAQKLAAQTMQGAAIMAMEDNPEELRKKVTSKGGTTHAAITHMQEHQVGEHLKNAMVACYDRSVELGQ